MEVWLPIGNTEEGLNTPQNKSPWERELAAYKNYAEHFLSHRDPHSFEQVIKFLGTRNKLYTFSYPSVGCIMGHLD